MKRLVSLAMAGGVLLAGALVSAAAIAPAEHASAPTVTVYKSPT